MGKKKTKNKRNRELKIIFFIILVALAMFIISTYAWFSTQKNVSITNLNGTVEVAEGLEISLNASKWANELVLGSEEGQFNITDSSTEYGPYEGHKNLSPTEMLPVSTLGYLGDTTTMTDLQMLRGKITNSKELSDIVVTDETVTNPEDMKFAGYFAFDIFLKNSSKEKVEDTLQLNYDSSLQITDSEKSQTGLQNTARVAFVKYGSVEVSDGVWSGVSAVETTDQATILKETGAPIAGANKVYITDSAIWEPNSNDHVEYIINNNNNITWSAADAKTYFGQTVTQPTAIRFATDTKMPTYALTAASVGTEINDIYNWDGNTNKTTLQKQVALQTTKTSDTDYTINEGVQNLISTTDESGQTYLKIAPNSIIRLRVYVWLEGQDVDCINWASHGGGITLNIGLVKGSAVGSDENTIIE